jgi:hypothetical protein
MTREPSTRSLEILPDIAAIRRVSQTLTDGVVAALNPDLQANDVVSDADEIGYPNRTS